MTTATKRQAQVHIRWMIRRDMPEVLAIESSRFEFPWPEEDFIRTLRQRNNIGMVAELHDKVVGYMIYSLHQNRLHILNIASESTGRGIGRQLIGKLVGKLHPDRRNKIMCEVRESNLDAQLFFKACGFRAISVLKDFYDEWSAEDAYLFQYRVKRGTP